MRQQQTPYPPSKRRASAGAQYTIPRQPAYTDLEDEEDLYDYPQVTVGRSARRYDLQTDQSYQQRQRQLPVPQERPREQQPRSRGLHPLVFIGFILICAVLLLYIYTTLSTVWQRTTDSFHYGYPRAYQVDKDVGHGDSKHPISHFVAINNNGVIEVIEIPGDPGEAKVYLYLIARISSDNAAEIPVTLTFGDVTGNGKTDVLVHVGETTYVLFNTGTAFKQGN